MALGDTTLQVANFYEAQLGDDAASFAPQLRIEALVSPKHLGGIATTGCLKLPAVAPAQQPAQIKFKDSYSVLLSVIGSILGRDAQTKPAIAKISLPPDALQETPPVLSLQPALSSAPSRTARDGHGP